MKKSLIISITVIVLLALAFGVSLFINPALRGQIGDLLSFNKQSQNQNKASQNKEDLYKQAIQDGLDAYSRASMGDSKAVDQAIDAFKKAAEYQGTWLAYLNLGNSYKLKNDYEAAERAFRKGLEKKEDEPLLWITLVELMRYQLNRSDDQIIAQYKEATKKAPGTADIHSHFGAYLRDIGKTSQAIEEFELLYKAYPDNLLYKQELENLKKTQG